LVYRQKSKIEICSSFDTIIAVIIIFNFTPCL
jgi:hypothetical protein